MDNIYNKNGCPALGMHDQRSVGTNFAPIREMNNDIMKSVGAKNSHEYRMHLQRNAEQILANEAAALKNNFSCLNDPHGEVTVKPIPANLDEGVNMHTRCHWFEKMECNNSRPVDRR